MKLTDGRFLTSPYFYYKGDSLYCEGIPVTRLVKEFGTPLYIYSKSYMQGKYREFTAAFSSVPHIIFYACKANFNLSIIQTLVQEGAGVDVNSEGELKRALRAGADPKKIILTGVGKTDAEIKAGIEADLLLIKAESEEELGVINEIAASLGKIARVAIRVNPDVDPKTHPYISTGLSENKFGIDTAKAFEIFRNERLFANIRFTGIDMHIGSQITSIAPYDEAVAKLADMFKKLKQAGVGLDHFDVGGGIGVPYREEATFGIADFANAIIPYIRPLGCQVFFEPGRYLTANGGALIAKVLYTKEHNGKTFIITDTGMNDLLRPSIYSAYHHIQPVKRYKDTPQITADVVGPVCESGDFLAKNRELPEVRRGDHLAVMSAGAYGMVMASNYNARRRAAEVLVEGNTFRCIRSRENYQQLLLDEEQLLR